MAELNHNPLQDMTVEYHNEVTINIGNFENVKPGYRVSATIKGGASKKQLDDARNKLKGLVDGWLEEDIKEHKAEL